jgi:flagellar motor switch protein FliN/FliY
MNTPDTDLLDADPLTADAPDAEAPSADPPATELAAEQPLAEAVEHAEATADSPLHGATMDLLADVELEISVELGRRRLTIGEVSRLAVGSVLELDTLAGEPLRLFANGRLIGTGEAVVVDGQFGIRISTLAAPPRA